MTNYIVAIILLLAAILGVVIRKTYYYIPIHEIRRQAQHGDHLAVKLYRVVAYDGSLRGLLWVIITFSSATSFVLLARQASVWLSLFVVIASLWLAFSWIPSTRVTSVGAKLTIFVTPAIAWLLNYLHPALSRGTDIVAKRYIAPHTGIFERSDLEALIDRQKLQSDNRLAPEELEIVKNALHFSDIQVADVMTLRRDIKTILTDDAIGPILIDELHKSGQDAALVSETPKGEIVGSLQLKRLNIHSQGKVRDVMDSTIYFVHEDDSLAEALHAFFVTNRSIFVVVNNHGDYVGVVTVQTMLEQLLGHIPGEDFDQYANPQSVAKRHSQPKSPIVDDDIEAVVEL